MQEYLPHHFGKLSQGHDAPKRPSSAEGEVVGVETDKFGRPTLRVRLDGGRIMSSVRIGTGREGARSGSRAAVPSIGSRGLINFSEQNLAAGVGYWVCAVDKMTAGLYIPNPKDAVSLHTAGGWEAHEADGSRTLVDSNGDFEYHGLGTKPYGAQVRLENQSVVPAPVFRRALNRLLEYPLTKTWGIRLAKTISIRLDAVKRQVAILINEPQGSGLILEDGKLDVTVGVSRFGVNPKAATPVALWLPTYTMFKKLVARVARGDQEHNNLVTKYNELRTEVEQIKLALSTLTVVTAPGSVIVGAPVTAISQTADAMTDITEIRVVEGKSDALLA
jgi:hypothetical protein